MPVDTIVEVANLILTFSCSGFCVFRIFNSLSEFKLSFESSHISQTSGLKSILTILTVNKVQENNAL